MLAGLTLFFSTAHAAPVTQIAPGDAQAFHNDIAALFNFDSGTLSGEELDAKLKAIKAFGARLSKDKSRYLPLLRAELARGAYLPVFATQGPTWLIGLSDEPADLQLAADYLARWTIDQVNLEGYVTVL